MIHPLKIRDITTQNNLILGPMAGVTSLPTRVIAKKFGAGLVCAEMVSGVGLTRENLETCKKIEIDPGEHPISMQLFGGDADILAEAAVILQNQGVDIVDLNCGCPVKKITKQCAGSSLMRDPQLVKNIVKKIVNAIKIPFTIKFRTGWDEKNINVVEMAKIAEGEGASMITVHGRTRAQAYKGTANRQYIAEVKKSVSVPVIASGDLFSPQDVEQCLQQTGCDGVQFARGFIGNPWLISQTLEYFKNNKRFTEPTFEDRVNLVLSHTKNMIKRMPEIKAVREMRKFNNKYIRGIPGAAEIRQKINKADTYQELESIFKNMDTPVLIGTN